MVVVVHSCIRRHSIHHAPPHSQIRVVAPCFFFLDKNSYQKAFRSFALTNSQIWMGANLGCVCVCCSVLQCGAVCCSVLQCVAVRCSALQCVAVCCSELQILAGCCSVLRCAAVSCIVLQCVAVCCSVLQCVAV